MAFLQDFFTQLTRLKWSDYLDIILVGFLLYRLLPMLRSSGAARIAKIVGLLLALTWLTGELHLNTLNFLLEQVLAERLPNEKYTLLEAAKRFLQENIS